MNSIVVLKLSMANKRSNQNLHKPKQLYTHCSIQFSPEVNDTKLGIKVIATTVFGCSPLTHAKSRAKQNCKNPHQPLHDLVEDLIGTIGPINIYHSILIINAITIVTGDISILNR